MHCIWDDEDEKLVQLEREEQRIALAERRLREREEQLRDAEFVFRGITLVWVVVLSALTAALVSSAAKLAGSGQ